MSEPSVDQCETWLNAMGSQFFLDGLKEQSRSPGVADRQAGKRFRGGCRSLKRTRELAWESDGLSVFETTDNHLMGICANPDGKTIWLSSRCQVWRREQAPADVVPYPQPKGTLLETDGLNQPPQWAGRVYEIACIPRMCYTAELLDVDAMVLDVAPRLIIGNTMFGRLAILNDRKNFKLAGPPPFLSGSRSKDRCYLCGLAMRGGSDRSVTVVCRSDAGVKWQVRRDNGACILETRSGEIVCSGTSMPHFGDVFRGSNRGAVDSLGTEISAAPTAIGLCTNTVEKHQSSGSFSSSTSQNAYSFDTLTCSAALGTRETDKASFQNDGNELCSNTIFNSEPKSSSSIGNVIETSANLNRRRFTPPNVILPFACRKLRTHEGTGRPIYQLRERGRQTVLEHARP